MSHHLSLVPPTHEPESWSVRHMTLPDAMAVEPLRTFYPRPAPSVAPDLTRQNFQASAVETEREDRARQIRAGVSQPVAEADAFDWDRFDAKFWRLMAVLAWLMGLTCAWALGTGLRLWLRARVAGS